jgi:hypothetical protein
MQSMLSQGSGVLALVPVQDVAWLVGVPASGVVCGSAESVAFSPVHGSPIVFAAVSPSRVRVASWIRRWPRFSRDQSETRKIYLFN